MAWKTMMGPGEIADRRAALEQLLERAPGNMTVTAYLGDLNVEEDIINRKRGGA